MDPMLYSIKTISHVTFGYIHSNFYRLSQSFTEITLKVKEAVQDFFVMIFLKSKPKLLQSSKCSS